MANKLQDLQITPLKGSNVILSSESYRKKIALKRLKANEGRKMLSQDDIPRYLESRIKALYERVKMEGALTQDSIPAYLAQFAQEASTVLKERAPVKQRIIVEKFKESSKKILDQISEEIDMEPDKLQNYKDDIDRKAVQLNANEIGKRFQAVQDIGAKITEAATKSEKELTAKDFAPVKKQGLSQTQLQAILSQTIIPIGFEANAPLVKISEFYEFPFGKNPPDEENWFEIHKLYLDNLVELNKIDGKKAHWQNLLCRICRKQNLKNILISFLTVNLKTLY